MPFVYIVRCADGTLYTGWTTDVTRRVAQHNAGRGAVTHACTGRWCSSTVKKCPTARPRCGARLAIKKLDRERKERLVELQR